MTAVYRLFGLCTALLLNGCAGQEAPKVAPPDTVAPHAPAPTRDSPAAIAQTPPQQETDAGESSKERALSERRIVAVTLLSPRSLSMKLRLEGGVPAVFKPIRKGDARARFETAAYKMAVLLGIEGVPVSVSREIPLSFLVNRLEIDNPEAAAALKDAVPKNDKNAVQGAMIEWMEDIDPDGLNAVGGMKEISRLIGPGRRDDKNSPLAVAASNMVVFDHIIGNWDRFSGGNFFVSKDAAHLILIDHNGSFTPWPDKRQDRMEKRLAATERFSASMLARIRALTPETIQKATAQGPAAGALLNDEQIQLLLSRRDEVLRRVDALIDRNGTAKTVAFP